MDLSIGFCRILSYLVLAHGSFELHVYLLLTMPFFPNFFRDDDQVGLSTVPFTPHKEDAMVYGLTGCPKAFTALHR
jgi:hypothetical protein